MVLVAGFPLKWLPGILGGACGLGALAIAFLPQMAHVRERIGHIFYVTGMFAEFYDNQNVLYIVIPVAVGMLIALGTILTEKILKTNYGRLKLPAFGYAITLFSMVSTAFSMWMLTGFNNQGLMMIFIGGILFAVSDLILNMTYFSEGHEKPFDIISNSITYYAAQFIIALTILFL